MWGLPLVKKKKKFKALSIRSSINSLIAVYMPLKEYNTIQDTEKQKETTPYQLGVLENRTLSMSFKPHIHHPNKGVHKNQHTHKSFYDAETLYESYKPEIHDNNSALPHNRDGQIPHTEAQQQNHQVVPFTFSFHLI